MISFVSATLATGKNYGAVTLSVDANKHFICGRGWGVREAITQCKGLGFRTGLPYNMSIAIDTSKPVLKYKCDEVKANTGECTLTVAAPRNEKYEVAAVLCYDDLSEYHAGGFYTCISKVYKMDFCVLYCCQEPAVAIQGRSVI
jgi:hypothetical protein